MFTDDFAAGAFAVSLIFLCGEDVLVEETAFSALVGIAVVVCLAAALAGLTASSSPALSLVGDVLVEVDTVLTAALATGLSVAVFSTGCLSLVFVVFAFAVSVAAFSLAARETFGFCIASLFGATAFLEADPAVFATALVDFEGEAFALPDAAFTDVFALFALSGSVAGVAAFAVTFFVFAAAGMIKGVLLARSGI